MQRLTFLALIFTLLWIPGSLRSQELSPASPPIANPEDAARFADVHEDWTTPALKPGELRPVPALVGSFEQGKEHIVELIQVQWRAADPIDLYVIKPVGVTKPPVILWLYGFPAETDLLKDETFHRMVTKGGFAAVGFMPALTGHRFHDRTMSTWFVSELQESLATSAHDVQMVLDFLASRNDLDMTRVGLFGQGSGGTIGILASAVDSRIKALDVLNPWGDWPEWLANSPLVPDDERPMYIKPEFLQKVANLDPLVWLPKVKAKSVRFEDASFSRVTPKACKDKMQSVLPAGNAVVRYETATDLQHATDGSIVDWIKQELKK